MDRNRNGHQGRIVVGREHVESLETRLFLNAAVPSIDAASNPFHPDFKEVNGGTSPLASAGATGYTPQNIRHAYGVDGISWTSNGNKIQGDGTGQTIALIDAYHDPAAAADLHNFDLKFGLPDPPSFKQLNQTGGTTLPAPDVSGSGGWDLEEAMDVEWAHAMAPKANIIVFEADSDNPIDLIGAAAKTAKNTPGVTAVSMSFGASEVSADTSYDGIFTSNPGHGVTFLAATGDSGAPGGYPAFSPNVIACGGTSLSIDNSGNWTGETAWAGGGGGISTMENQPAYQKGVVKQSSTHRAMPDVAMDSDPNTGVAVLDSYDGGWVELGGTSLSAPIWAGLVAIADQRRASAGLPSYDGATGTLPRLYALPQSDFHDITSGSNGDAAGPGYDLATGRGSPKANQLVLDLANVPASTTSHKKTKGPKKIEAKIEISLPAFSEDAEITIGASDPHATDVLHDRPSEKVALGTFADFDIEL